MRKPNYSQERQQRERDKAAKAREKEAKRLEQKAAKDDTQPPLAASDEKPA